jgi:hypothetical protein
VSPSNPVIPLPGGVQQLRVVATYSDGKTRDVTREAFLESGNTEVGAVLEGARVQALRRGEVPVLARYEGAYAATTLTVMGDRNGYQSATVASQHPIDRFVASKWDRMKIQPSPVCTDADFLRRVTLDLTGMPPTPEAVRAFLADPVESKVKRERVIDELVASEAFVDHWTNKWSDLLQVNSKFLGKEGAGKFKDWIRNSIATNKPYDKFVHEITQRRLTTRLFAPRKRLSRTQPTCFWRFDSTATSVMITRSRGGLKTSIMRQLPISRRLDLRRMKHLEMRPSAGLLSREPSPYGKRFMTPAAGM